MDREQTQSQESSDDGPHQEAGTYIVTQDRSPTARIEVDVSIAQ